MLCWGEEGQVEDINIMPFDLIEDSFKSWSKLDNLLIGVPGNCCESVPTVLFDELSRLKVHFFGDFFSYW